MSVNASRNANMNENHGYSGQKIRRKKAHMLYYNPCVE